MHSAVSCLGFEPSSYFTLVIILCLVKSALRTHLVIILVFVVLITLVVLVILIIFVLKLVLVKVVQTLLELQRLASEPVDRTWDKLLLDVLAELVVELKLRLDLLVNVLILIFWR